MIMNVTRILATMLPLALWALVPAGAQEADSSGGPKITGGVTLGAEFYDMDDAPDGSAYARRPPNLYRLQVNLNAAYSDIISLPFSLTLTSRETNVTTPRLDAPSIGQMLLNPLNSLSFSPRIGWAQLYLGTHTQTFSELSGGDAQIVGLGVDLRPGGFRVAASAGLTQRAVDADTVRGVPGAFARRYYALKLGYGREGSDELVLGLNLIRSEDDPESITRLVSQLVVVPDTATPNVTDTITARHRLMPIPVQNVLGSFDAMIPVAEGMSVRGEFAISGYTRDQASPLATAEIPVAGSFMDLRTSTRADYAATLGFSASRESWGIDAKALYIRPGFATLGYPLLAPDRLEFTVSPRATLFDGDLSLGATFGHRSNNLSSTSATKATQVLISANAQAQLTTALSVGGSYTNFGLRNTESNDTLKIESVAQSASITPSLSFTAFEASHALTLMLAVDAYTDLNTINGALNDNNTRSVMFSYALSFEGLPLSFDLSAGTLTNHIALGDLIVNSASFGCSVRLLDGALVPSLNAGLSENTLGDYTADVMLNGRLGLTWRITDAMRFGTSFSLTDMTYGSARPGARYTEQYGNASLSLNF